MSKYQDSEGERVHAAHVSMIVASFNSQDLILRPLPLLGEGRILPNPGVIIICSKCEGKCRQSTCHGKPRKGFLSRETVCAGEEFMILDAGYDSDVTAD